MFRVIIVQFINTQGFDVRSVKKSCVTIVHRGDGRLLPFDTDNQFYRDETESTILARLRGTSGTARVRLQMQHR